MRVTLPAQSRLKVKYLNVRSRLKAEGFIE